MPEDPFDLQRFVDAQDAGGAFRRALGELRGGHKTSHWMWFVFPQISGLGSSEMSRRYAISGLPEALGYVMHPVLGVRLLESCAAMGSHPRATAMGILGPIDAQKLRSSMTLFLRAAGGEPVFAQVLQRYFEGVPDPATDDRLRALGQASC